MEVQPGSSFVFNGLTNDSYVTRLPVKQDCLSHASLDEVVELPAARAETATPAELLDCVRGRLGPQARLALGFDLVTGWRCRHCGEAETVLKPLYRVSEHEALCPVCQAVRVPDVVNELTGEPPLGQQPLSAGRPAAGDPGGLRSGSRRWIRADGRFSRAVPFRLEECKGLLLWQEFKSPFSICSEAQRR